MAPDHRNTETGHLEFIIDIQFMCTLQETNIAMDMAHLYTDDLPVLPINMGISIAMEDQEIVRTFHLQSRFPTETSSFVADISHCFMMLPTLSLRSKDI